MKHLLGAAFVIVLIILIAIGLTGVLDVDYPLGLVILSVVVDDAIVGIGIS